MIKRTAINNKTTVSYKEMMSSKRLDSFIQEKEEDKKEEEES